jgi:hypothetical protein
VTLNKWNHIAITIDTSIQANNANIYINGSIDKTFSVSGYLDWGGGRWNIGSSYVFNNKFSGYIDDVKVENYVASPSNILAMYGAAAYNTWAQTDSMVYGRIDHTSTTLLDSAGNATSDAAIVGGKGITYIALQPALLMMFKPEKYSHYYSRYNQISQKIIISGSYTALNTDGNIIFVDPSHSSPKRFKYNLTLPSASSCKDGQVITASISPYLASSDYTIKVAAQNNDAINGANVSLELKKSSVTFILDSSTNPPTWWQIDSGS